MAKVETVTCRLHLAEPTRPIESPLTIRPIDVATDKQALLDLYFLAFHSVHEFNGWPLEEILQQATNDISLALANLHPHASCLAEDEESKAVVGATMIDEDGSQLRHIMRDPAWQRQGIATQMLNHASKSLADEGKATLGSRYAKGNEASREWHHRMGFVTCSEDH